MEPGMTDTQMMTLLRMVLMIAEGSQDKEEIVRKLRSLIDVDEDKS